MTTLPTKFKISMTGVSFAVLLLMSTTSQVLGNAPEQTTELSETAKNTILEEHNKHRAEVNVPALEWSSELEADAKQWAAHLAELGGEKLIHATLEQSGGQGENLWKGKAEYFSYVTMVDTWANEQENFKPGIFPNVSTTDNGYDVSHYTQVVWKNTTKIGCAKSRAGGNDLLVCRYDPMGNVTGQSVF